MRALIKGEIPKSLTSDMMTKVMSSLVKEALKDELTAIIKPLGDKVQCLSKENDELRLGNSNLKKEIRIAGIEEES